MAVPDCYVALHCVAFSMCFTSVCCLVVVRLQQFVPVVLCDIAMPCRVMLTVQRAVLSCVVSCGRCGLPRVALVLYVALLCAVAMM